MEPENPYQAPAATDIPDAFIQPGEFQLASRGERLGAAIADGIISLIFLAVMVFGLIWAGTLKFVDFTNTESLMSLILTLASSLFFIGINWKLLTSNGQTLGKKFANIRIVTLDGQRPSIIDLVLKRYGFYTVVALIPVVGSYLSIINVLFIFGKERRCLHDYVAGTRVVKNLPKDPRPQQGPPAEMTGNEF